MRCPNCSHKFDPEGRSKRVCPYCGFPYAWPREFDTDGGRTFLSGIRLTLGKFLLVAGLVFFFLTAGGAALFFSTQSGYYGAGQDLPDLKPISDAQLEDLKIEGPAHFEDATRTALALIQLTDPRLLDDIRDDLTSISYLPTEGAIGDTGDYKVLVSDVNAFIESNNGKVYILPRAYGGGTLLTDYHLYHYAAVLVHEWKHRRNWLDGKDYSPQMEEVVCERAALDFLKQARGPKSLIDRKEIYLADPDAPRYKRWYEFGKRILSGD